MTTVFVAGSMNIKKLDLRFLERLSKIVDSNLNVVVGDADGADTSIQEALLSRNATAVTVYCSGTAPRNNVGCWPIRSVHTDAQEGTRAFYTAKDLEMSKIADYGLMVWDTKSTGTLNNVIELLKEKKKSVVFVNKNKSFVNVSNSDNLRSLVGIMSEPARVKAESKLRLSARIASLDHEQLGLPL